MSKHLSIIAAASLLATSAMSAVAADLVHHDGFETCWSQALTKPQFLAALRSNIDGNSGCIPPQAGNQSGFDYTICNVANGCGSGAPGCPVALQAGPFSGDFVAGSFAAAGTANNIAAPITVAILGSCTLNITGITLTYALDYLMRTDGTDGVHTDDMQVPLVDITNYATSNNGNP